MMLIKTMQSIQQLTTQEQHIVDYILNNPTIVFEKTAHELAKLTLTSPSTIVRLCKKLGTSGYPDFQLKLALDYRQHEEVAVRQNIDQIHHPIELIPAIYDQAIVETKRMLDHNTLHTIVNWIKQANRIDIYGSDANYYIAQQACAKWNESGITAIAQNTINHHYLSHPHLDITTLSFVISHTGKNRSMLEIAQALKDKQMRVIAITADHYAPLAKISDYALYTHTVSSRTLNKICSTVSTQYLFDLLYMQSIHIDI